MTTKQKFEGLKYMSLRLSSFLVSCEKNPELMEAIQVEAIINQLYKELDPILGEPVQYVK